MSSATGRGRESRPGRLEPSTSNATTNRNRSCRPLGEGQATTEIPDRRGAFLATTDPRSDSVHALVAARLARSHASKSARLAALCGVVKVLQSPQIPEDPDAGAGLVTATAVGARAGEPAARSTIERGGRLKRSGTHPLASVARGQRALGLRATVNARCVRYCVRCSVDMSVSRTHRLTEAIDGRGVGPLQVTVSDPADH